MDIVDSLTRSRMMAGIRSKNTLPERLVRSFLHARGFRYRIHDKKLPGKPDIVLPKHCVVIFIHGCFWHQHPACKNAVKPKTNSQKWIQKFSDNEERDQRNLLALKALGWRVIVLWECGLGRKISDDQLGWLPDAIRSSAFDYLEWPVIVVTS
ncbi:Very short patch repair protein (DNA mismatch endonuclease) (Vsr mismatch endonuclease) [Herminiimonas arsenicoxydans]|uniref:Very short patch repair endonuclease n=1 Tax=Herminiimonas arsenicoxydans TaxID=204773 RepID=A4G657_HERAR|nr:Very short patch repair protein (DNA mismatch endonuclease) (Vsr mismatch endonuclease) [Herminiimonas arsenicoxydans]